MCWCASGFSHGCPPGPMKREFEGRVYFNVVDESWICLGPLPPPQSFLHRMERYGGPEWMMREKNVAVDAP
eukprot:2950564-Pyramimonas_sp.AAC.1